MSLRKERRALRTFRLINRLLRKLPAAHLSPRDQLQRLLPHLQALHKHAEAEDLEAAQSWDGSSIRDLILRYLSFMRVISAGCSAKEVPAWIWAPLFRILGFTEIKEAKSAFLNAEDRTQLIYALAEQATLDETDSKRWAMLALAQYNSFRISKFPLGNYLSLLDGLKQRLEMTTLLSFLRVTPIKIWQSFTPDFLRQLWEGQMQSTTSLANLGAIIPQSASKLLAPDNSARKIWGLHTLYYLRSFTKTHREDRQNAMHGTTADRKDAFKALKFILSSLIHRVSGNGTLEDGTIAVLSNAVQYLRDKDCPPDRQVMAAILHAAQLCHSTQLLLLHSRGILYWIWQEWVLQREDDPKANQDQVLVVAFLDITATSRAVSRSPEYGALLVRTGLSITLIWHIDRNSSDESSYGKGQSSHYLAKSGFSVGYGRSSPQRLGCPYRCP